MGRVVAQFPAAEKKLYPIPSQAYKSLLYPYLASLFLSLIYLKEKIYISLDPNHWSRKLDLSQTDNEKPNSTPSLPRPFTYKIG